MPLVVLEYDASTHICIALLAFGMANVTPATFTFPVFSWYHFIPGHHRSQGKFIVLISANGEMNLRPPSR